MPGDPQQPSTTAAARAHAHEDLAGDAAIRATQAREAATRCMPGEDRDYCIARAETLEREADRLRRDAQRESRG